MQRHAMHVVRCAVCHRIPRLCAPVPVSEKRLIVALPLLCQHYGPKAPPDHWMPGMSVRVLVWGEKIEKIRRPSADWAPERVTEVGPLGEKTKVSACVIGIPPLFVESMAVEGARGSGNVNASPKRSMGSCVEAPLTSSPPVRIYHSWSSPERGGTKRVCCQASKANSYCLYLPAQRLSRPRHIADGGVKLSFLKSVFFLVGDIASCPSHVGNKVDGGGRRLVASRHAPQLQTVSQAAPRFRWPYSGLQTWKPIEMPYPAETPCPLPHVARSPT
jgi:hypothetical protein